VKVWERFFICLFFLFVSGRRAEAAEEAAEKDQEEVSGGSRQRGQRGPTQRLRTRMLKKWQCVCVHIMYICVYIRIYM
jgi:hypothetical protein